VPGSRGGYGLNQWTGPRRRQFEAFAASRGAPLDDVNTQLDFTLAELQGPESKAWSALQGARDPIEAARIYSETFLRPGIPRMDKRLGYAAELAGMDPSAFTVSKSSKGGRPMGLLDMGQMPEEDQGGIVRLLTGESKPWASRMNDIGAVLLALSGSPAAQPLLNQIEKRKDRKAQSAKDNKTLAWLASQGREDLVAAVQGGLPAADALRIAMTPQQGPEPTALMQNVDWLTSQGIPMEKALEMVRGGVSVNLPGQPTIGTIPPGYQAIQDPQTGAYRYEPIPGGPVVSEIAAVEGQKVASAATAEDSIRLIDSIISDPALPGITGMLQGRLPPFTQAGTDLSVKLDQVKGQAFLEAFESLKGGGAITDREGQAATDARARLNRAQSTEAIQQSLLELKELFERGRRRALAGVQAREGDEFSGGTVIGNVTVGSPVE